MAPVNESDGADAGVSGHALLANCDLPRLEARMLLEHVLACSRSWLLAYDNFILSTDQISSFNHLVARRNIGEPMAYLVGTREFMGHAFAVGPDVLIPRPDTEVLVEMALVVLTSCAPQARVLDLGTGSGAIAVSIALSQPTAHLIATDISVAALAIARGNAQALGAHNVQWLQSKWYEALPENSRFDVIVSNPPYIAYHDPHLHEGDLRFEPRLALTDEGDGLAALRHIIEGSRSYLYPGGVLWLEHGWNQAADVRKIFVAQGFVEVTSKCDLNDIERITGGRWIYSRGAEI